MNDGLFARELLSENEAWTDVQPGLFGHGTSYRLPAGIAAPSLAIDTSPLIRTLRERLRDTEAELGGANAIFAQHPEPTLVIDRQRTIVRGNAAAKALNVSAVLANKDIVQAVERVFGGSGGSVIDFKLAGTVERHLRARLELLPDHAPSKPVALLTVTDLTEVKRAEQLRADFVANASHELRTPLAVLLGFIETLTGPASDDQEAQRQFLPIMQQQANRMARLVDDLLSLSRIELTEHAAPTRQVDVAEVVGPVARALGLRAAERDMRIELNIADNLPPVLGEPDELAQIFQNLIDNAIKYARPGTAITVTAGPSGKLDRGVAVKVRDRGEGIAKQHLSRLTERFYRADAARASGICGTGLGLAIVKHVVNRHHGLLEIASKVGRGSRFTVHLAGMPGGNSKTQRS